MERINGWIDEKIEKMKKTLLGAIHFLNMSWDDHPLAANGSMDQWIVSQKRERWRDIHIYIYIYDIGISNMTENHGLPLVALKNWIQSILINNCQIWSTNGRIWGWVISYFMLPLAGF